MRIEVDYLQGKKSVARFNGFEVFSDIGTSRGGNGSAPEPYDFFPAATVLCVAHYIRSFCEARSLDFRTIKLIQEDVALDEQNPYQKTISVSVQLPNNFPEKYIKPLLAAANGCTVKKVIENKPKFEIRVMGHNA